MAAAEYYNGGPMSSNQQYLHPQQASTLPYPSDTPPPYTAYAEPRPHSQPPPQHRPVQSGSPYPPPNPHAQYSPGKNNYAATPALQNMYRPQDFNPNYRPQPPPTQGYPNPQGMPVMQQGYSSSSYNLSSTPAHDRPQNQHSDEKRDRSRSRSRSRHRQHHNRHEDRPRLQHKKSSGVKTFLGAGGGAIIGDAIFPGLGTLGGAILGGIGGHEYGKRSRSHPHRTRERSYSSNDGTHHGGEHRRGRRHDY